MFFSGGVSKNVGMRQSVEEVLEVKLSASPFDPQLTGALGAAVIAKRFALKEAVCH